MFTRTRDSTSSRGLARWVVTALVLVLLVGYVALPLGLRYLVNQALTERGVPVRVGSVHPAPFDGLLVLRRVEVLPDGVQVAAWDRVEIGIDAAALAGGEVRLAGVRLSGTRTTVDALRALVAAAAEAGLQGVPGAEALLDGPLALVEHEFVDLSRRVGAPVRLERLELEDPRAAYARTGTRVKARLRVGEGEVEFEGTAAAPDGRVALGGEVGIVGLPAAVLALAGPGVDTEAGKGSIDGALTLDVLHLPRQALFRVSVEGSLRGKDLDVAHPGLHLSEADFTYSGRLSLDWPMLALPNEAVLHGRLELARGRLRVGDAGGGGVVGRAEGLDFDGVVLAGRRGVRDGPLASGDLRIGEVALGPAAPGDWSLGLAAPNATVAVFLDADGSPSAEFGDFQALGLTVGIGADELVLEAPKSPRVLALARGAWSADTVSTARIRISRLRGRGAGSRIELDAGTARGLNIPAGGTAGIDRLQAAVLRRVRAGGSEHVLVDRLDAEGLRFGIGRALEFESARADSVTVRGLDDRDEHYQLAAPVAGTGAIGERAFRAATLRGDELAVRVGGRNARVFTGIEGTGLLVDFAGEYQRVASAAVQASLVRLPGVGILGLAEGRVESATFSGRYFETAGLALGNARLRRPDGALLEAAGIRSTALALRPGPVLGARSLTLQSLRFDDGDGASYGLGTVEWSAPRWSGDEGLRSGAIRIERGGVRFPEGDELSVAAASAGATSWDVESARLALSGVELGRAAYERGDGLELEASSVKLAGDLVAGEDGASLPGLSAGGVAVSGLGAAGEGRASAEDVDLGAVAVSPDGALSARRLTAGSLALVDESGPGRLRLDDLEGTRMRWAPPAQLTLAELDAGAAEGRTPAGYGFRAGDVRLSAISPASGVLARVQRLSIEDARARGERAGLSARAALVEGEGAALRRDGLGIDELVLIDAVVGRTGRDERAGLAADRVTLRSVRGEADALAIEHVELFASSGVFGFDSDGTFLSPFPPRAAAAGSVFPVSIAALETQGPSRVVFFDVGADPPYRVSGHTLDFRLTGFDSVNPERRARADLGVRLDRQGKLAARLRVQPTLTGYDWEVEARLDGLDLAALTGYSRRHLDGTIDAGAGDFELDATVRDGTVSGTLGMKLVGLETSPLRGRGGTAAMLELLRDRDGTVALEVPLQGTVRDLRPGATGTFARALTSTAGRSLSLVLGPAGLLPGGGSGLPDAFSGVLEIAPVYFEPGRARPSASTLERLGRLARALGHHPDLELRLCGVAVAADRRAGTPGDRTARDWPLPIAAARADTVHRHLVQSAEVDERRFLPCAPRIDEDATGRPRLEMELVDAD